MFLDHPGEWPTRNDARELRANGYARRVRKVVWQGVKLLCAQAQGQQESPRSQNPIAPTRLIGVLLCACKGGA
jgi:hypothetical protein